MPLTRIRQTAIGDDSITSAKLAHDLDLDGQFVRVPHGTTAERPSSPVAGYMRFNTTLGTLEQWNTNTNSWAAIDSPPIISSLAYSGSLTAADPAGGETITLTGTNFKAGASVTIGATSATSVTVVSSTSITFTTPVKTAGDYDVAVVNANGLQATLTNGISYNGTPSFTTAAGNVGSVQEDVAMSTITIVAAEPDGGTLAYSITSGALPTGVSLGSANGQITGTPNVNVTSDTTYNFTVTATDDESQTNSRAFNLIVLRPIYATVLTDSARFDDNKVAFLTRTPSSAGNRRTWTWSGWVKRANIETFESMFAAQSSSSNRVRINFGTNHEIQVYGEYTGGTSTSINLQTNAKFRDPSGWLHIVLSFDTTQSTASNRAKLYVNGELQSLSTATYPAQNDQLEVNTTNAHFIGQKGDSSEYLDGYLSDVYFIDGQALTPTSFAEEYYGVWAPKVYSGSYGTNGFHLDFQTDSQDSSGNNNHWIPNSLGSSLVKYSGSNLDYPNNLYKILDGDNSTAASIQGSNTSTSASFIYTPATPITVSSSLKFKYSTGQTDCKYKINGGSYVNLGSSGTVDFNTGFTGTLTSIEWYVANSNSLLSIYDLRVNDVQVINYDIGHDSLSDTPTNNFATWSPLTMTSTGQLQNGNLKGAPEDNKSIKSTFSMPSGKWYWENKLVSGQPFVAGICPEDMSADVSANATGDTVQLYFDGRLFLGGVSQGTITTFSSSDIIGVTYDASIHQVTFYKNGTQIGQYTAPDTNKIYAPFLSAGSVNAFAHSNFGQDSTFGGAFTAGGNADGNGIGEFKYSVPSGYLALCSKNLAESPMNTSLDDRPEDYFNTVTYTGNGGTQSVTVGFQPDFTWIKNRGSGGEYHNLFTTVQGATKRLFVNDAQVENTDANTLTSFDANGFSVGSNSNVNGNGVGLVSWNWKAGGTPTATNSAGAGNVPTSGSVMVNGVASTDALAGSNPAKHMSVNTKSGFSVVHFTLVSGAQSIAHGLGKTPSMIILKGRDVVTQWWIWHTGLSNPAQSFIQFTNGAAGANTSAWNNTAPTSTVFHQIPYILSVGNNGIAYCFAEIEGFSKFGTYTANQNTNGPFIHTGFKPAFVLIKSTNRAQEWIIIDNKRDTHNPHTTSLSPDTAGGDGSGNDIDFTASGFKIRTNGGGVNYLSGDTMIYAAFAEDPFKYSEAE